jgi:hypothetical protein
LKFIIKKVKNLKKFVKVLKTAAKGAVVILTAPAVFLLRTFDWASLVEERNVYP